MMVTILTMLSCFILIIQYGIFILSFLIGIVDDIVESKRDLILWIIPFGVTVLLFNFIKISIKEVVEIYKRLE